jgi:plasmid maintenance system antidote protein VapI
MTDSFERLRSVVLAEVAIQRAKQQNQYTGKHPQLVGMFLKECLTRQGKTTADLAQSLQIKPAVAEGLLNGDFPGVMLSDQFITRLAGVVGYSADTLKILWGLDTTPAKPPVTPPDTLPEVPARKRAK